MPVTTLPSVLDSSLYIPELRTRRRDSVLAEMVARAQDCGVIRLPEVLRELLLVRERIGCTAIGKGVAVPHARSVSVLGPRLVVARSHRGIDWAAPDGLPVTLVFMALSPAESSETAHHQLVSSAIAVARYQRNRSKLLDAKSFDVVSAVLREVMA
jgi:mannitol/fructose-specific phosphotransferase system IIA component (Ntr-type)